VNNQWSIAADNFIEFGKRRFKIHQFFIDHAESRINIASVNDQFNDDLNIDVINFRLDDLSRIIEKDTAMIKGTVDGNVLLKRIAQSYGLIADISVVNLIVRETPIGNVALKASRTEAQKFELDLSLSGPANNLTANGYFIPNDNTNSIQTESTTGTSTLIRSTVSKFLSAQLNQLGSNIIPGMELNFDIQSYEDYQTGQAQGRTQVEIGVKQQLFNERLSVELGGSVDVEGDQAKQNSASDIASDVTVEYKLTKDGRLRMKGFRHNQYEGAIEGQLVETEVGVVYVRDFNRWSRLFKSGRRALKSQEGEPRNKRQ